MSVHLVGGGRDLDLTAIVYRGVLAEVGQRATASGRAVPRIAVVVVAERDELDGGVDWFRQALASGGRADVLAATAEPEGDLALADGCTPTADWWSSLDGLLVAGGLTPAYHRLLLPHAAAIRAAVTAGLPYAGFSAGAMIAPPTGPARGLAARLHGGDARGQRRGPRPGHRRRGTGPDLVHGRGAHEPVGTLSRLVAVVAAGLATSGIAVDENTVVILDVATDGPARAGGTSGSVVGAGQAWFLTADGDSVRVDRREAGP
jgi:cyanophycinase